MSSDAKTQLLAILDEAKEWLRRAGNDFSWSSWENAGEAIAEIENLQKIISNDEVWNPMKVSIVFSPTGDLQEVSLSSGWGNEFLELADRADRVLMHFK